MERQPSQWLNPTNIGLAVLLGTSVMLRSALLLVLFGFLSVIVILAHWWGRYALDRVEYRRFLERSRCFVGEEMELRIELTNRKILPITYLAVDDTMPLELHIGAKSLAYHRVGKGLLRFLFGLAWYQKVVRRYRLTPTRRGFYRIGPAERQGGDPLGYVKDSRTVTETNSLIVYPRVVPLDALGLPTRRPFGDLKSKDRLFEDPMRFAGVREYQPGDPLNRIHWKASAAAGELQVRLPLQILVELDLRDVVLREGSHGGAVGPPIVVGPVAPVALRLPPFSLPVAIRLSEAPIPIGVRSGRRHGKEGRDSDEGIQERTNHVSPFFVKDQSKTVRK